MAYEIHTLIDADGAPTDGQTKFDNWYSNHNFVLTDQEQSYTKNAPRDDGTLQGYHEFRVYLSLQDDLQTAISDLEAQFPDASWMVVNTRRNDAELLVGPWASDKTYHDPDLKTGLRVEISPRHQGHGFVHNDIHYTAGGKAYTVPAGDYVFDKPEGAIETTLYANGDSLNESSGVKIADVEVHPGRIVNIEPASQPTKTESWSTAVTRGSPPSHFANETEPLPDELPSDYIDRNQIDDSDIEQIYQLINNHPNPETAELARNIMNVIFN